MANKKYSVVLKKHKEETPKKKYIIYLKKTFKGNPRGRNIA